MPGSSLGRHLESGVDPGNEVGCGKLLIGSLSTRVSETWTATGREHFSCQDSGVSHIFILIILNGEKVLSNVNVIA